MPTVDRTGQKHVLALTDVLVNLMDFDPRSDASMSLWLSRLLEQAVARLDTAGSMLFSATGTDVEILAKHGISDVSAYQVIDLIKDSRECLTDEAESPEPRPEINKCPEAHTVLAGDDLHYTFMRTRLIDGRLMWLVFATSREPGDDMNTTLKILAMHIFGVITGTLLIKQARASAENLEKINRELKEMQLCSLNIMEDLQKRNRDLGMLNTISQEIATCTNLSELAAAVTHAVTQVLEVSSVGLYTLDESGTAFIPYEKEDADDNCLFPVSKRDRLFSVIANGKEILLDATRDDFTYPFVQATGCKSGLIMPLRWKTEVLGFLLVCDKRWHRIFNDEQIENLRVLASTLSIAFENISLLSRTTKQVEEMSILTEYIETIVDSIDLGVLVVDRDLNITVFNKGFERLYGEKKEDFIGRHIFEAYPNLVEQGFTEIAHQVMNGKPFVRNGWRRTRHDGREVVQNIRISPHRDAQGTIIGGIVIIEDITEKADLEDQLARSEAKFSRLVENLGDGYLIVGDERIVYANKAASQLTGIPIYGLLGKEIKDLLSDEGMLSDLRETDVIRQLRESRLTHNSGTWIPVEVTVSPCEYGEKGAVSLVIRDITERKKFEKQLEEKSREMRLRNEHITRLNLELEATVNKLKESQENLIKSERLAAITETSVAANHEINNPLFSILGQAQLLLRKYENQDAETLRRLRVIEESALRIACVTKKLANLADPVVKEYPGLATSMIDLERSATKR
jgi:PAS domain S-box-containing protein